MTYKRTIRRVTQPFAILTLVTLLLLAAALLARPLAALAPLGMLRNADGTWTTRASAPPSARYRPAMASLGGDQVLLFGGGGANGLSDETWVYDPSDNTWTQQAVTAHPSARRYHTMAYLGGPGAPVWRGQWSPAFLRGTWSLTQQQNLTNQAPTAGPLRTLGYAMASSADARCSCLARTIPAALAWRTHLGL